MTQNTNEPKEELYKLNNEKATELAHMQEQITGITEDKSEEDQVAETEESLWEDLERQRVQKYKAKDEPAVYAADATRKEERLKGNILVAPPTYVTDDDEEASAYQ